MAKRIFRFFVVLMFIQLTGFNPVFSQNKIRLATGWSFYKGDLGGIWESVRVQQPNQPTSLPIWEEVVLPHCFNSTDAVDPYKCYYQGPGWYRTFLSIENPFVEGRTFLHFEGAGQKTAVYVGVIRVGCHVGGYDAWSIDITDAISKTKNNQYIQDNYKGLIPVSIRCDNSRDLEMIPSDLSDFHIYGGLYRNVYLVHEPSNWFESLKIGAWVDVKGKEGVVTLEPVVGQIKIDPSVNVVVRNSLGEVVFQEYYEHLRGAIKFKIAKPWLWSPSQPNLYTLRVEADFSGQKQVLLDHFGFKHIEFQKDGPFYLNGERFLLRGTHRHEDFAGVAAAETEEMLIAEMKLIKRMGANFIRLGHYQQSNRVLELCDSLGILVWEEIPWCRGGVGGEKYKEQARRMLENMIEQHYNHASVIIWGLGNENDWPGDFETFNKDSVRAFMSELNNLSHSLDSSRLTAIRRCEFCKNIVDVYSPSIWPGWYRGSYNDYERVSRFEKEQVDRFLHVEWGADSHVGRHTEQSDRICHDEDPKHMVGESKKVSDLYSVGKNMAKEGDWSESYAVELYDWILNQQTRMPWLTGTAFWTFKDFATPIRPENPIPYVNQKGVVQRDLTPKEVFYVVQAYWGQEPMIHIYGHSWPIRWGAEGEPKSVKVYSNCDQVELFLNGKSVGIKKRDESIFPAMGLNWVVSLNEGVNKVKAVGVIKSKEYVDEVVWSYQVGTWGPVAKLLLKENAIDAANSLLTVTAIDAKGKVCLDSKITVEFYVVGDACLLENQGTAIGSRMIQLANGEAKIKLVKTGKVYSASVKADGLGSFLIQNK